jgi:hypothetical protein
MHTNFLFGELGLVGKLAKNSSRITHRETPRIVMRENTKSKEV